VGGEPARTALPMLRKALEASDPSTQSLAAVSLARAGKDGAGAVDALARALTGSRNPEVRRNCCIALGLIGTASRRAVPAIVEALKPVKEAPEHPDRAKPYEEVREQAAEALAQIGFPENAVAIPAIRDAIARDKNQDVRQRCVWALFQIEDPDKLGLTRVLTDVLDEKGDDSVMVRYDCARVLAYTLEDKAPDRVVDLLLEMLENRKLKVFNKTDASIEGTGNEAGPGSSAIARDLGGDARYMAAQALGRMKEKSRKNARVMKALREAAREVKEPRLHKEATTALERLGEKP
jgi:HEAT repeat protein